MTDQREPFVPRPTGTGLRRGAPIERPLPPEVAEGLAALFPPVEPADAVRQLQQALRSAASANTPALMLPLALEVLLLVDRDQHRAAEDLVGVASALETLATSSVVGLRTAAVIAAHLASTSRKQIAGVWRAARRAGGAPVWAKEFRSTTVERLERRGTLGEFVGPTVEYGFGLVTASCRWSILVVVEVEDVDERLGEFDEVELTAILPRDEPWELAREREAIAGFARAWGAVDLTTGIEVLSSAIETEARRRGARYQEPWPSGQALLRWLSATADRSMEGS